jgi:hypothetical protein
MCAHLARGRHTVVAQLQWSTEIIVVFGGTRLAGQAGMRHVCRAAYLVALFMAAGCGRSWPEVHSIADPRFLAAGGIQTVAILLPDVAIAASASTPESPEEIADRFDHALGAFTADELMRRGYTVTTGPDADAALHIGGFAYSGENDDGVSAGDVAKAILIGVAIVVVVVAVLALSKGHGGGHGGHGGVANAAGHAVFHAAHGFVSGVRGAGQAFSNVQISMPVSPAIPEQGESHTLLQATLIDVRTGRMLWQVREDFPADPARPNDVHETVVRLLGPLPRAR